VELEGENTLPGTGSGLGLRIQCRRVVYPESSRPVIRRCDGGDIVVGAVVDGLLFAEGVVYGERDGVSVVG